MVWTFFTWTQKLLRIFPSYIISYGMLWQKDERKIRIYLVYPNYYNPQVQWHSDHTWPSIFRSSHSSCRRIFPLGRTPSWTRLIPSLGTLEPPHSNRLVQLLLQVHPIPDSTSQSQTHPIPPVRLTENSGTYPLSTTVSTFRPMYVSLTNLSIYLYTFCYPQSKNDNIFPNIYIVSSSHLLGTSNPSCDDHTWVLKIIFIYFYLFFISTHKYLWDLHTKTYTIHVCVYIGERDRWLFWNLVDKRCSYLGSQETLCDESPDLVPFKPPRSSRTPFYLLSLEEPPQRWPTWYNRNV